MKKRTRSIERIIEEQVQRWQIMQSEKKHEGTDLRVITISREPGSGGRIVAQKLAQQLGFDLFHQEVVHEMAESAKVSKRILNALDEKGVSTLEDWISSLVDDRYLWPDQYMKHLLKIIGTIGKFGRAVIVGRGANFALQPEKRFAVRVVAPRKFRAAKVAQEFNLSLDAAQRRILKTEADRRAFIRKYYHADIADPINYDMVLNTQTLSLDSAAETIAYALRN
jgi:cytidylate kinase